MRYVFRDTETSGADTRYDQILQFAAILTDSELNELEVIDIRSRRLPHVLPSPVALKVTHIDPWSLTQAPYSYFEFARIVHEKFREWSPATFIGQNVLSFDEEMERSMFYQNLLDPYVTNSKGSARADTLVMLRVAHALRPGVLIITNNPETGSPIFKLEVIAPNNGFESHKAHDALGDVRANIFVAKILKTRAPDIWNSIMRNTSPDHVDDILAAPTFLAMTHFGKAEFFPATKIAMNPTNKRQALLIDLSMDIAPWLDKTPEELAENLFGKESPFQTIKTNAQPTVFSAVDPIAAEKWAEVTASIPDLQERYLQVSMHPTFQENCIQALKIKNASFTNGENLEEQIYNGFPSWGDKDAMKAFHRHSDWRERQSTLASIKDERMKQLGLRLIWQEAPEVLDPDYVKKFDRTMIERRVTCPMPELDEDGNPKQRFTSLATARFELKEIAGHELEGAITSWYDMLEAAIAVDPAAIRAF